MKNFSIGQFNNETTVGGFPASRGKRELWMRENSRGNYYAGNAGKTRVHKILKIPTKVVRRPKLLSDIKYTHFFYKGHSFLATSLGF